MIKNMEIMYRKADITPCSWLITPILSHIFDVFVYVVQKVKIPTTVNLISIVFRNLSPISNTYNLLQYFRRKILRPTYQLNEYCERCHCDISL